MNCGIMPYAVRVARLAELEHLSGGLDLLPSGQPGPSQPNRYKRRLTVAAGASPKRAKTATLASRVELMATELAQVKSLLRALHPSAVETEESVPPAAEQSLEDDIISVAASANLFTEYSDGRGTQASIPGSHLSVHNRSEEAAEDGSIGAVIRMALARLQLDIQQPEPSQASAFFRRTSTPAAFSVPPSVDYVRELHACWRDTSNLSRPTADSRILASMQDAAKCGLERMPAIEPTIASLIVSPEETLRPEVRCPRPQCRVTDELLSQAYNTAARMGRIGNSLSHLMLALSESLQQATPDASVSSLSDASLQAFGLMSRELGRLMSTLVHTRRQVWLAQSPLSETCRRTLRSVPVEPGEMFGSAAIQALQRTVQAGETRQQFSNLRRDMPPPRRVSRGPTSAPRDYSQPQARPNSRHGPQRPAERPIRLQREAANRLPSRLNDAPVRGYEEDVGNKTTMRFFYPESASYNPGLHNEPGTLMVLVPFKQQDLRWLKEILYNEKRVRKGFWKPPPQIWLGDMSKIRVLDPHFLHQTADRLLRIPLYPKSKQAAQ
ncbi:CMP-N-acetylneuraminate-beta-galactosamide-alpha-2,3-sialyltransferase 4 [Liparis tanakae]|uniref:CMP-N-acetylneuraminate-beta-galactosamide-alpha-2,3-sialyltransferase 4 n=1 Tax=Liparis tanakae TaxID=230148 RepID=A0A4Z2FVN2_9TELE|nr:CMP-N-acetylneuraminate-beta-galactosamide-alpha-2,3-sialyltransferase 4 [Liparis tanakae]